MTQKIHSIFATPIFKDNIKRNFTDIEINFIVNEKKKCEVNEGNINTTDNYILNRPELLNIKQYLEKQLNDYLHTVICPLNDIKLVITQSWINYTEENQFHHKHEHPNSIVSGTFYLNSDVNNDRILFSHPISYQQINPELDQTKYNIWNSQTWWFPVKTGDLLLFPSSTTHQVKTKKGKNTRISLAFNTFYKGNIGKKSKLTELIL